MGMLLPRRLRERDLKTHRGGKRALGRRGRMQMEIREGSKIKAGEEDPRKYIGVIAPPLSSSKPSFQITQPGNDAPKKVLRMCHPCADQILNSGHARHGEVAKM